MNNLRLQHMIQGWISTIFGVVLMVFSAIFFYNNIANLTLQNILIGAVMGAVGFIFLFVKDDLITNLFKKQIGK
jgi:hypothetical protein